LYVERSQTEDQTDQATDTFNFQRTTFNSQRSTGPRVCQPSGAVPPRPSESRLGAALNRRPVTWAVGPGWYGAGPSALESLLHKHQRSGTESGAFMAEKINYAAMQNEVVMVGHGSAKGAAYTSVGRSTTTRAISRSPSTIQGLKARTIPAMFSCISRVSWLGHNAHPNPFALTCHPNESSGAVVWSGGDICGLAEVVSRNRADLGRSNRWFGWL